ncbi:MAG TPA: transposase [Anaerolineae bacterium]
MERFYRRRLPHWEIDGAWYFVTFRLYGSIPRAVFEQWQAEIDSKRKELIRRYKQLSPQTERALTDEQTRKIERYLDSQMHVRYLERPTAAEAFICNLERGTGTLYCLGPWVIMPNHVHVILAPKRDERREPVSLARILQHLKGASAIEINRALKRSGALWQREYFDRIIRSMTDFNRKAQYIEHNPAKAGLCGSPEEWPWSSASRQLAGYELLE